MPEPDKRNLHLVVELLRASNHVERMSHEEIRSQLRKAAALLLQRPDDDPVPASRPEPAPGRRADPAASAEPVGRATLLPEPTPSEPPRRASRVRWDEPAAPAVEPERRADPLAYDPTEVLYPRAGNPVPDLPPPSRPERDGPNWRLFVLMFAVGFFGLVLVGFLFT